jgi:hypothetical protein
MNCSDFEKTVLVLANDRLIEVGRRGEALRHTETCASCAARLAAECALVSGVRAVRAEIANERAPAHLEAVLLNAFRERAKAVEIVPIAQERSVVVSQGGRGRPRSQRQGGRERPRSQRWWASWKVAVAAAVLVFTSIGAIVFVRSTLPDQIPTAAIPPVFVPDPPAPDSKVPDASDEVTQVQTVRHRSRHRANRTETVTDYFPLIEGEDLDSVEFAQVVRVELSASALREVGLPMSYASDGEPVKADIVLGQDGVARAIRFVR